MNQGYTRRGFFRNIAAAGGMGWKILGSLRPAHAAGARPRNYYVSTLPFKQFPLDETLRKIRLGGFDAVELANDHVRQVGDAGRVKELAGECGIGIKSVLAGTAPADEAGLDGLLRLMDELQRMGVNRLSVASGGREQSDEAQIAAIIRNIKALVAEAEKREFVVSFYTHTNNMAYNLERTERIFREIPSSNFRFYYSPYHFHAAGEDPVAALKRLQARLAFVYFNCGVDPATRTEPFWGPAIDYRAVCRALVECGYAGDIMLLYLGLKVSAPDPIVEKLAAVREQINGFFASAG